MGVWSAAGFASAPGDPHPPVVSNRTRVVSDFAAAAPPLDERFAEVASAHLPTFLKSDTLDSQATNAIFQAYMTVVGGGNVCGLATICLVELFVCLATSLPGKQAQWFHS